MIKILKKIQRWQQWFANNKELILKSASKYETGAEYMSDKCSIEKRVRQWCPFSLPDYLIFYINKIAKEARIEEIWLKINSRRVNYKLNRW